MANNGQTTAETEPYKVQPVEENTPIYLEHLAKARMYHETWRVVIYIDLEELDIRKNLLSSYINKLRQLCAKTNIVCRAEKIITQLDRRITRVKTLKLQIDRMIGRTSRRPRGIFNPIGEIGKILFGTLSSTDAEYYNTEIDKLHGDIGTVATLVKNQTQIIKTQILANLDNIKSFNDKLSSIDDNTVILYNLTARNRREIEIEELAIELTNLISEYSEDTNNLMNAIADGKHGMIHPQLVSPDILFETLRKTHLEAETLPVSLDVTSFTTLTDISECSLVYMNDRLLYILLIPILEIQHYDAYRVIPIPHRKAKDTFFFYDPPDEYIILNSLQTTFMTTNTEALSKCKSSNHFNICKRENPEYSVTHKDACLTNLLKSRPSDHSCTIRYAKFQKSLWIQLKNNVQWIVTPAATETIHVICPDRRLRNVDITKTSILTIRPDCQGITDDIVLKPERVLNINTSLDITLRDSTNNTELEDRLKETPLTITDLPLTSLDNSRHLDMRQLKGLGNTLDEIDNQIEILSKHKRTRTTYEQVANSLKYAGYAALIIIILYLLCKLNIHKLLIKPLVRPCSQVFINCFHNRPSNAAYSTHLPSNNPIATPTIQISRTITREQDFTIKNRIAKS